MKNIYWHIQMFLPEGRDGDSIESIKMLQESQPVIGTGEWDDLQCRYFKSSDNGGLNIGDIILVREGGKPLALCRVKSNSFTNKELEAKYINRHYRYVDVLDFYNGKEFFPQPQGTLQRLINNNTDSWKFINNWYKQILNKMETTKIVDILKQKKQIILQGAPGTGKTYITASVALSLIGETFNPNDHKEIMEKYDKLLNDKRIFFTTFHQSMDYEDFIEGLKPVVDTDNMIYEVKDGIFKKICKSAEQKGSLNALEQAIEKLKEACSEEFITAKTKSNVGFSVTYRGGITFRVRSNNSNAKEGKDFPANIESIKDYYRGKTDNIYNISYVRGICDYLMDQYGVKPYKPQNNDLNYVLIIDEINRGNVSKIFGELITLLEVDKRTGGEHPIKVRLAYSNEENFTVPSNLYIIGTMNTTDRSVGHIDYAIRRRFAFYTLTANKDAITSYYDTTKDIESGTKEIALYLFEKIEEFVNTNISPEFDINDIMIGHSYFMAKNKSSLKMKLEYEIIPLLKEYEKDGIIALRKEERKSLGIEWVNLFETTK
jgi:5-methylcytosine-specific restriction protein B